MGRKFFDIQPYNWFYKDVVDMESVLLDDDIPFVSGYPFNDFVSGFDRVDHIIDNITSPNSIFEVPRILTNTAQNPVIVYVDGIITIIDEVNPNVPTIGSTQIKLRRVVGTGSTIRVVQQGIPSVDPNNRNTPIGVTKAFEFPSIQLDIPIGENYIYNPFSNVSLEVAKFNGSQLKRIPYSSTVLTNYLFFKGTDEYTVSPSGKIYVPFDLNNQEIEISYSTSGSNGIENPRYKRGRVKSEQLVYFGFFPDAVISRAEFFTFLNNIRIYLTRKLSDSDPFRSTKTTSRFTDVQSAINQNPNVWYWQHIRDLEEIKLSNGDYLINGRPDGNLYVNSEVTRAEIVVLLDLLRVWFVEAFM
jgi:hypothetical protein